VDTLEQFASILHSEQFDPPDSAIARTVSVPIEQ
jgi:hypothetical protein